MAKKNLYLPDFPYIYMNTDQLKKEWTGLHDSAVGLAIAKTLKNADRFVIAITPDSQTATQLKNEVCFFNNEQNEIPIFHFPDWETLAYDHFSPHEDIISERLTTLYKLGKEKKGILFMPISTLLQRLPPQEFLGQHSFILSVGDHIDTDVFRNRLTHAGYQHASQVMQHGEFTIRGSILDLFPMGSNTPFRIDLLDDEVDSIRLFDPENQRSIKKIDHIRLLPAREFPLTDDAIRLFRQQWRSQFPGNPMECSLYQDTSQGICAQGIEYYLPLFFKHTQTFFDYIPDDSLFITVGDYEKAIQTFLEQVALRYEQLKFDLTRPILPPQALYLTNEEEYENPLSLHDHIHITAKENHPASPFIENTPPPSLPVQHHAAQPLEALKNYIMRSSSRILFCAETAGRRETLIELLQSIQVIPVSFESWHDFIEREEPFGICVGLLERGLCLKSPSITIITESQLFGEQVMQRRLRQKRKRDFDPDTIIRNLAELRIGTPIVHIDHGVGRYRGLQTMQLNNITSEFLTIEYANQDKLYVPVASLHLISRYTGGDPDHAPLNKLGSDTWEKTRKKAAEKIRDVAAELLDLYARREVATSTSYSHPDDQYQSFAHAFPFEETPDQMEAIKQVIADLTSSKKMDRLVCGDVGFGKTEVAMRAAFFAVHNGKQVAILAPTTLLAQQHFENFKDRFVDWPVHIDLLSRFRTKKEQDQIVQKLSEGKIDIIIGTHRLLQKDIRFKNLSLLIIDEEHRFGVRDKDKIKNHREKVDILTLTATPIPRTMNMSLAGIRDLSIIATPPAKRLSIKTFVHQRQEHIISEAIRRELLRGGQVYFLHNKVQTIEKIATDIQNLVTEARVGIAHGQMRERQLEKIMTDFYHHRFNVLVCTTIIESGIDIPTANTILIDRADRFGLAQLHQLRGRVGRSHHQAYAYLLIPHKKAITPDANKRLDAFTALDALGAGFSLASHDLEIRGAGELLGEEQSGHMQAIGFSLYMELLDRAIEALKSGKAFNITAPMKDNIEIDLKISALIPDDYLYDVHQRLILYKRISLCKSEAALDEMKVEMIDRFGLLRQPIQNLFALTALKLKAKQIGIQKIEANEKGGLIQFEEHPNINPDTIINLIQKQPNHYKLAGNTKLRFMLPCATPAERIQIVEQLLKQLTK